MPLGQTLTYQNTLTHQNAINKVTAVGVVISVYLGILLLIPVETLRLNKVRKLNILTINNGISKLEFGHA